MPFNEILICTDYQEPTKSWSRLGIEKGKRERENGKKGREKGRKLVS